jgi:hypothetical protein
LRWVALVSGIALIALAVAAVTRVSDTREGLVAEVITLLGAAAGVLLLIYGLAARSRRVSTPASMPASPPTSRAPAPRPRSAGDLRLGGAGLLLALVLLGGLAFSGGVLWAALGFALLLPMIAGSVYLCVRYLRANP